MQARPSATQRNKLLVLLNHVALTVCFISHDYDLHQGGSGVKGEGAGERKLVIPVTCRVQG